MLLRLMHTTGIRVTKMALLEVAYVVFQRSHQARGLSARISPRAPDNAFCTWPTHDALGG